MEDYKFDPSVLRGKIKEKGFSESDFAKAFGISSQAMSKKLNRKSNWSMRDTYHAIELLGIQDSPEEIMRIFFRKQS